MFCLIPALEHVLNNFFIGFAALLLVVTEVVISVVGGVVGVVEVVIAALVAAVVVAVAIVQGEGDLLCGGIGLCVHDYIETAILRGATVIVVENIPVKLNDRVVYLQVENSRQAIGIIARNFYDNPSSKLKLIGVTGTNGKTTIATLSYNLFKSLGFQCGLISTIINRIGYRDVATERTTPDVVTLNRLLVDMLDCGCEYVFMEVSSHAVVQKRIEGLSFFGGVFINITHDHLDYHKTFANYICAKQDFFNSLSEQAFALTNADDRNGGKMLENSLAKKYTYSLTKPADFKAKIIENCFEGLLLEVNGKEVSTRLVGKFNAYNLLAIYGIARLCGLQEEETLVGLSNLRAASGRFGQYLKEV